MTNRNNDDGSDKVPQWWQGPATIGQLLIAVALAIGALITFLISNAERIKGLEDQARVNVANIQANAQALRDETLARQQFDGSIGAKLDTINDRLSEIAVNLAVIKTRNDAMHATGK